MTNYENGNFNSNPFDRYKFNSPFHYRSIRPVNFMQKMLARLTACIRKQNTTEDSETYYEMALPEIENPSISLFAEFDAKKDAENLREAMKGVGADDKIIINTICFRTNTQRQAIAKEFKTMYGLDLVDKLKSETKGNFRTAIIALMKPTLEFYVDSLKEATRGLGTDEDALIEILCGMPPEGMDLINEEYKRKYKKSLEADIKSDTSGHFQRLLVSICASGREPNSKHDREQAKIDANELFEAGEGKMGTDESKFNAIMCHRSFAHIRLVNEEYINLTGETTLAKAIEKEFSGNIKKALLGILQCALDKHEFFAQRLHKSMAGLGTNDNQLIRILVSRSEIDLSEICRQFNLINKKDIVDWIKGDTSGSYRHCLLAIIGIPAE